MFGFLKKSNSKDASKARKGSNGFYMELDESKASASENGKQPAAEPVKVETAPAPAPAAEPAKATKPAAKSKPAKAKEAAAAAPAAAPAKPAAPAAAANGQVQPQAIKTFAPDYLLTLTSTNGRRRPGANMNSYLEMARQMKTR
ncbi:MAG TPA: hypothetical protein DCY88_29060 [Cyanobacteria bacterium UBA11372]|nr:hypothetical protein [Cyanobacteria bacterium UBA11372]